MAYVFLHAHPDDETLWTGALIATLAGLGERVIVITCTRGERGEVIPAELAHLAHDGAALAAYRTSEVKSALAALGSNIEHYFLDELGDDRNIHYQDSGMVWVVPPAVDANTGTSTGGIAGPDPSATEGFANAPLAEPSQRLAKFLVKLNQPGWLSSVETSPETSDLDSSSNLPSGIGGIVLVTYEQDGGYGHPDHVRAHEVAVAALAQVQASGLDTTAFSRHSTDEADCRSINIQLWEVTKPGEPSDLQVPVAPVLPKLLAAMEAYRTQVQDIRQTVMDFPMVSTGSTAGKSDAPFTRASTTPGVLGWFALSNGVPIPIRDTENYRISTGGGIVSRDR